MERVLHPRLAKRSLQNGALDEDTAQTIIEATRAGLRTRHPPGKRGIDVDVTEIHEGIAAAVVHSDIYREYLHLLRTDEGWKIVNALWDLA